MIIPEEEKKFVRKMRSQHVTEWFCDAVLDFPMLQNIKIMKAKAKRRWNTRKSELPSISSTPTYSAEWTFQPYFWRL